jgi:hypothetical protein
MARLGLLFDLSWTLVSFGRGIDLGEGCHGAQGANEARNSLCWIRGGCFMVRLERRLKKHRERVVVNRICWFFFSFREYTM